MFRIIRIGLLLALVFICVPAFAQLKPVSDGSPNKTYIRDPNTFGTLGETSYSIFAWDFEIFQPGVTWSRYQFSRYLTSECCLEAGVRLPNGAAITGLEVDGCDFSTTGQILGLFAVCDAGSGGYCVTIPQSIASGVAATPSCGLFRVDISPPLIVNNAAKAYLFEFSNPGDPSGNVNFQAARIFYKLQVSPAPATATFSDVPTTHLFYQYIEALAASGITSGCGVGIYCPDAPLTRGQMAVFLSRGLGLHWPN